MGMNPKTNEGKWRTSIWGFLEREEFTPLGGGSKKMRKICHFESEIQR